MPFCTLFNEIFKTFSLKSLQIQKLYLFLHPQLRTNGCKVGAIAQLVEQRTENPCVPGSIPGGTTQETPKCLTIKYFGVFLFIRKHEVTYKVTYELHG